MCLKALVLIRVASDIFLYILPIANHILVPHSFSCFRRQLNCLPSPPPQLDECNSTTAAFPRRKQHWFLLWFDLTKGAFPPSHFCNKLDDKLARKITLVSL
jgi:hypothetical protein